MIWKILTISLVIFSSLIFLSACASQTDPLLDGKISVTVSILPQKYIVERIGGDKVSVNVMVGPGDSPHTYEPKPEQMAALSRSTIYFAIGVEFEGAWMGKIASANPKMKIVDLSENFSKLPSLENEHEGEPDPHIWTSPEIVKSITQKIAIELSSIDENNSDVYQANLEAFNTEINQLQDDIRGSLEKIGTRQFLVFHPAWGYFAREFGLEEIPIEIGGTEPSASELGEIIDKAKRENIRVVFAQPEFSSQIADYIAKEIGGQVVLISPLGENWLENLRSVAKIFEDHL